MTRRRALITGLGLLGILIAAGSCLGPQKVTGSATPASSSRVVAPQLRPSGTWKSGTLSPSAPGAPSQAGVLLHAYVTAYTWYDNDPTGAQIADPVLHRSAGGTGTYADPVTLAVAVGAYPPGTQFYLPHVHRYFLVEDTCAACWQRPIWVDMWIDGRSGSRSDVQACAGRLTGHYPIELNPPAGRPVYPGPLFSGSGCHVRS